ncbi:hypothetical protein [Promicromonospora sp. NPDC057488]|uniref:hypothetical protein n=1 Tax=Promicromonospora sp. NPDC057488 TaxID=3346147 RepID=UPI00366DB12E
MSIDDTDVVARLRAGADRVERHEFDAGQVVAGSRRALRRRRTWQALGGGMTAVAVAFSLALAGPVPVPGVGEVALPGSERVRELFGLEAESAACAVDDDLTVEWGNNSSHQVLVQSVGHVIDGGAAVRSATIDNPGPPAGEVSSSEHLLSDVAQRLPMLAVQHQLKFAATTEDGYEQPADVDTQNLPDGTYIWWNARDLGKLSGVARCDGLPVTWGGDTSSEFTITTWNGTRSSGVVDCGNPPERPSRLEREALEDCEYLD